MRTVTVRRRLVMLILVYVALDLALPSMPGAFVFDAAESVESVQRSRSQDVSAAVSEPSIVRDGKDAVLAQATTPPKLSLDARRVTPVPRQARPARHPGTPDLAPPSEDPH
ncbi:MAG: hypothetical protein FJZ38_23965 [Candidatus Rokubacteria bacterium]|nr:hypothetical protein [Candidatus Rokubacteria bacterium]